MTHYDMLVHMSGRQVQAKLFLELQGDTKHSPACPNGRPGTLTNEVIQIRNEGLAVFLMV